MKKIPMGAKLLHKWLQSRTVTEWAQTVGITDSYACHLRKGRKRPSIEVALRIERATEGAVPVAAWAE